MEESLAFQFVPLKNIYQGAEVSEDLTVSSLQRKIRHSNRKAWNVIRKLYVTTSRSSKPNINLEKPQKAL